MEKGKKKAILMCPFKQEMYASDALQATFEVLGASKCLLAPCPFQTVEYTCTCNYQTDRRRHNSAQFIPGEKDKAGIEW